MKKFHALLLLLFSIGMLQAQETIQLKNPSFEDTPHASRTPKDWIDCGFPMESPTDTQPNGAFGVTKTAQEGKTYLGMVVRDNDTWEAIGQKLSSPLEAWKCYGFSLYLARSENYKSVSRRSPNQQEANYITPVVLRIWGGTNYCEKLELLAISMPIADTEWKPYFFKLSPTEGNVSHIILEAYYEDRYGESYNGNLLVDHASEITPLDCNISIDSLKFTSQLNDNSSPNDTLLKKITIPESVDPNLFWEWVLEYGPKIKFSESGELNTELYTLQDGTTVKGNIYLHFLALAAQKLPGSQLQIHVYGHDAAMVRARKQSLQNALHNWGFISERVKLFTQIGDISEQPEDLPDNAEFFATEFLGFYWKQ